MTPRIGMTGAFGYNGSAVARRLLKAGETVHTLTNRADLHVEGISVAALRFDLEHLMEVPGGGPGSPPRRPPRGSTCARSRSTLGGPRLSPRRASP